MIFMCALASATIIAVGFVAYAYLVEPYMIRLTKIEIDYPDLPASLDGLTICHLSDMHAYRIGKLEAMLGKLLAGLDVDLCAITGDTVSTGAGLAGLHMIFYGIKPRLGIFAVPGNGDYKLGIPIEQIADEFKKVGIRLLFNESVAIPVDGEALHIIGVDDPHSGRDDLELAESGVTGDGFRLLLAHSPDILVSVREDSADLILSGHTHGGQVRLPFIGAVWLHCKHHLGIDMGHFGPQRLSGILKRELPHTHLYVSRGLGGSGIRARFMCPPEVAVITLRKNA